MVGHAIIPYSWWHRRDLTPALDISLIMRATGPDFHAGMDKRAVRAMVELVNEVVWHFFRCWCFSKVEASDI